MMNTASQMIQKSKDRRSNYENKYTLPTKQKKKLAEGNSSIPVIA